MKYIKTFINDIIRLDEIYKISYEMDESGKHMYSYFYLKNGEKHDGFDCPDSFLLREDGQRYEFCMQCHSIMNEIMIKSMIKFFNSYCHFYDLNEHEEDLWDRFIEWAKRNEDKLTVYYEEKKK